jgi:hypothetical protein
VSVAYEPGDRIAVWEWASHHKSLVSIVEAEPTRAMVEYGPSSRRRREWTAYDKLTRRSDGLPVTYDMVINGLLNPRKWVAS